MLQEDSSNSCVCSGICVVQHLVLLGSLYLRSSERYSHGCLFLFQPQEKVGTPISGLTDVIFNGEIAFLIADEAYAVTNFRNPYDKGIIHNIKEFLTSHDSEHTILHFGHHLIHLGILRKAEAAEELTAAALNAVPPVILLLLLFAPLSTDLENPSFFNLHLHFFLLQSRKISLEDMSFGCFLPINASVDESGGLARRGRRIGEGIGEEAV
ncbi:hypothetical protein RJ641_008673 [Dillenia turbinata]|uniref:Uncharacterized protein n=1 Tax=Dillenia turbinata TaxID=194707 RepID=A0AAN8Z575_9MAGN